MAAQKTIQLGCRWQIGNGEIAKLWRDKWLPTSSSYRLVTPPRLFLEDALVSILINPVAATWKLDLIHELFLPFDAEVVLSIPLSASLPANKLIWAPTSSGQFTVSSAYKIIRNSLCELKWAECSSSQHLTSFWRCIWKMHMPNKVKVFAWRAYRNILPTKANLFTWKVTQDNVCEECRVAVESSGHLFWHCSRAQKVWKALNLGLKAVFEEIHEFIDLVWYARNVKQMDAQALAQLFMIAWGIWSNRNVLGTYFYVIGISFDKTHFTCIWVNLSRFKMIITSS